MQPIELLIANDQLREALDLLLIQSEQGSDTRAQLLQLSGQLSQQEDNTLRNNRPASELEVQRNQIRESLAKMAQQPLTAASTPTPAKATGSSLKRWAFYLLVIGKILLFLLVAFHYSTHGFSQGEALAIVAILSPTLVGYITKVSRDHQKPLSTEAIRHLPALRLGTFVFLPLYFITMFWVLSQTPRDIWPFETTRNWLLGIEAAFGALLLWWANTLFGEEKG